MKHYIIYSYKMIKHKLPEKSLQLGDEELITELEKVADLVCGFWVLKSIHAGYTGKLFYVRELILLLFALQGGKAQSIVKLCESTKTPRGDL